MSIIIIDFLPALAAHLASRCRNLADDPLRPETQQRLVNAVVSPSEESWLAARAVMVRPGVSVAEAVRRYLGSDPLISPAPDVLCFAIGQEVAGMPVDGAVPALDQPGA